MMVNRSRVSCLGVSWEALQEVLGDEATVASFSRPDVLVVGPGRLNEDVLGAALDGLDHCAGRPAPYVVLPDTLPGLEAILGALEFPYIVYGESRASHIRLCEGRWADSPLGSAAVPPGRDALESLAVLACALLLRIDPVTAMARLGSAERPLAA